MSQNGIPDEQAADNETRSSDQQWLDQRHSKQRVQFRKGSRIDLETLLDALVQDELLDRYDANLIRASTTSDSTLSLHPLVLVANRKLEHAKSDDGHLDLETLSRWLARRAGLDYMHIDTMKVDVDQVTGIISQAYARQYSLLPVHMDQRQATIATCEPFLLTWLSDLTSILGKEIRVVMTDPLTLNRHLLEFYGVTRSIKQAVDAKMRGDSEKILNFEQLLELGESHKLTADDKSVIYIVDWLLQFAFDQRASDIHLEPRRDRSNVRFRIDGNLHQVYQMPTVVMHAVNSRIKILGRMDVAEKRRPQDGRIKTRTPDGKEVELRLSTMPTAFGEKCVMRIFDPDLVTRNFSDLGFSDSEQGSWRNMVERPNGIVLVTGPTGSGKTTTLYSTLKHLARPEINVCSIEDPIEMVMTEFNQMQVQNAIDVTFAQGVRTLLRQDPDIIMIGEIRDLETAQMAIQASLTGHLVLSTLHTNDAPSAIVRLLDLGVPHYLLRGTLTGVVAQRLVRTLCVDCKEPGELSIDAWAALTAHWKIDYPGQINRPVGCKACRNTGYRGRTAIYEMLPINAEVSSLINPDIDYQALVELAYTQGMKPLRVAAANKVASGLTTIEEVAKVLPPPVSRRSEAANESPPSQHQ